MTSSSRETSSNLRWKVGEVQSVTYGDTESYGYGFSIQNVHGAPLLSITYETEIEAKQAEKAIRQALENAVHVMSPISP